MFQAKRKKSSAPEKPAKKPKSGESSKPGGSSKGSGNSDDNMFQVGITGVLYFKTSISFSYKPLHPLFASIQFNKSLMSPKGSSGAA